MATMKAAAFIEPGRIELIEKPIPTPGPGEAVMKITTTTICGTDVHILKGEFPVEKNLTIGHEPVGIIHALGAGVTGFEEGDRVLVGAITPSGTSNACWTGDSSQDGPRQKHGYEAMGGWRFGNTIDGSQAEYILVPDAAANLAKIPDNLTDEQVLMCTDIMSTGFMGAENGDIQIGDTVAIFAQGPIGLCATAGAKLMGATTIITVDGVDARLKMSRDMGADVTVDFRNGDPVQQIMELTDGRGVDVAIEALGRQMTFENALKSLRPGGTLSSLGVYSDDIKIPLSAYAAGLGGHKIVNGLCPGGKDRMRRLVSVVETGRADLGGLVTHRYKLDQIVEAYDLFGNQRDGVLKVAITP